MYDPELNANAATKKKKARKKIDSQSLSQSERMELYQNLLSKVISTTSNEPRKCVLHPNHDILWKEEQSYTTMKGRNNKRLTLHKCGECDKTFHSRYYLDLHMKKHHGQGDNENENEDDNDNKIQQDGLSLCPADEWCTLLGGNLCDRIALQDEPYYAPGIHDEKNSKSQQIELQFKRQVHSHPCNETELQLSQEYCMEVMNDCFGDGDGNRIREGESGNSNRHEYEALRKDMIHTLCHTQTCRHRMIPSHWIMSNHDLRREWEQHHDDIHHVGAFFIFVVLLLIVYGISHFYSENGLGVMPIYRLWTRLTGQRRKTRFDLTKRKKLD